MPPQNDLVDALRAAEQCMADVVEVWERGAGTIVLTEAMHSVKFDGLKKVRAVLKFHEAHANDCQCKRTRIDGGKHMRIGVNPFCPIRGEKEDAAK